MIIYSFYENNHQFFSLNMEENARLSKMDRSLKSPVKSPSAPESKGKIKGKVKTMGVWILKTTLKMTLAGTRKKLELRLPNI